jgi:hypothetical protein
MKTYPDSIPFKRYFLFAEAVHLAFAIPALCSIWLLQLLGTKAAIVIFTMFLLSSLIASWMTWMIAKGSNWANTAAAMKTASSVAGQLYGTLAGGLAGWHFFGKGIVMLVLFFVLGKHAGFALGGLAAKRLVTNRFKSQVPVAG